MQRLQPITLLHAFNPTIDFELDTVNLLAFTASQGQTQAKEFLKEHKPELTKDLLSKSMKNVKMIVSLLIGHCRLNRPNRSKIALAENIISRFCKEQEKIPDHVLCYREGLASTSFLALGAEIPTTDIYIREPFQRLQTFERRHS